MARLDPKARAMLRAYRGAKTQPAPQREALWSRIEGSLDAGALGPSLPSRPRPRPRSRWVTPVTATAAAAAVVAAIALGVAAARRLDPQRAPSQAPRDATRRVPAVTSPRAVTPAPASAKEPRADADPPAVVSPSATVAPDRVDPREPPAPRRSKSRSDHAQPPSSSDAPDAPEADELRAEMTLIRKARQVLRDDRAARALEILDAHARAFPQGQMREDRQALRIEALCAAGKQPQARAEVRRLLRDFPVSAHAARVQAMCAQP